MVVIFTKAWIWSIATDDMGLGKSIQTISYLLYIKENNLKTGPALIVAPTSVLEIGKRI